MPKGTRGWTLLQRLLNLTKEQDNGCWEYQGGKNNLGYGLIRDGNKMRSAHRVSYEEHNNQKIPKYLCVCHTCDNPKCVNPDHLWLGTRQDNTDDMIKKGRQRPPSMMRSTRGIPKPRASCKHCGVTMSTSNLARYHNDNCKYKP